MKLGLLLVFLLYPSLSFAHSFKLDSYGCHNNSALNVYECHTGKFSGLSWPNPDGKTAMLVEAAKPPVPAVPTLAALGHSLSWNQTTPPAVDGFRLFWSVGTDWHGPVELGVGLTATLPGLLRGATYRFYVVSYNSAGVSPQSNVVILEIP